ncbi:MAG TPA: oligosaccharide flippase family protein [Pirellulales bacterium]|jgi:O-antigen/teichoic acid export membrane protein|nr:oligosaccharide flippase family protein [Pirellulales bacterium]
MSEAAPTISEEVAAAVEAPPPGTAAPRVLRLSKLVESLEQMTPARRASFWTIFCYGSTQALRLVSNVMLAWLLYPEAFGVMTIVNVFVQGLQMFSDIGIGPSIIQHRRGENREFVNTAWTLQVLRGTGLAMCASLMAWPLARFYGDAELGPLIVAAGLTAAISGFNSTVLFTVRRSLNLGAITLLEIGAQAAGVIANCTWALVHPSVWALMAGAIISAVVRMAFSHALNRQMPNHFAWDREAIGELMHFGRWIFLSTIITFCALQGDRILLSKLIPLDMLGVYTVAITVALMPNVLLGTLTFSVLYPLLCHAGRTDHRRLETRLLRARGTLLKFGLAMVFAVGAGAELFFHLLYDPRYYDAVWMTRLMCVPVWMMVLNTTLETSLLALGDSRSAAGCNLAKFLANTLGALVGFHFGGVPGFILGLAAGGLAAQGMLLWALARHDICVVSQDVQHTALLIAAGGIATLVGMIVPHGAMLVGLIVLAAAAAHLLRSRNSTRALATATSD